MQVSTVHNQENIKKYTAVLIAQYLKKQGYDDTLKSFLRESSIPMSVVTADNDSAAQGDDLNSIISERMRYNDHILQNKLKNLSLNEQLPPIDPNIYPLKRWNFDCKFENIKYRNIDGIPIMLNFCENDDDNIIVSTSTRQLEVCNSDLTTMTQLKDQQNKSFGIVKFAGPIVGSNYYFICSMFGEIVLYDESFKPLPGSAFKPHERMVTHIQFSKIDTNTWYMLTASMDNTLKLNILSLSKNENDTVNSTFCEIWSTKLLSTCTTLNMAKTKVNINGEPVTKTVFFLTRMDFTHIVCYTIDNDKHDVENCYNIALNNAQFSTHSFNVRDIVLINTEKDENGNESITGGTIICVATSHIPYMRLVMLKFPDLSSWLTEKPDTVKTYYDTILRNIATQIPQDSYSQPIMRYVQKFNGIIIGSDKGIYAIDLLNGESWKLDTTTDIDIQRIKSIGINQLKSELIIGSAMKTIYHCNI